MDTRRIEKEMVQLSEVSTGEVKLEEFPSILPGIYSDILRHLDLGSLICTTKCLNTASARKDFLKIQKLPYFQRAEAIDPCLREQGALSHEHCSRQ